METYLKPLDISKKAAWVISTEGVPPTRIFDNVLIVSTKGTNAIIVKTTEGLFIIDAMVPEEACYNLIAEGLKSVGWNPGELKALLITHGHCDHTGCGRWLIERHGVIPYMSERDYQFWRENPIIDKWPADFEVHHFLADMDTFTLGDVTVTAVATPGHTPGGLSFIFPVKEMGKTHMAALWGGTQPQNDSKAVAAYLRSLDRFLSVTKECGVDVALTNHPIVDNGHEKMALCRERMQHVKNPYIIGYDGWAQLASGFREWCYRVLETL